MLKAKYNLTSSENGGPSKVSLMDGEEIQTTLGVSDDGAASGDVLLLTDRRVIHISAAHSGQKMAFAAISDIASVELTRQPAVGYGAFVWAGLAFIVSFTLWRIIENQTISIGAAVIVAILGIYLIIDRLTAQGEHVLVFRAGTAEIRAELDKAECQADAEALVTRLFELKEERSSRRYAPASKFSPR